MYIKKLFINKYINKINKYTFYSACKSRKYWLVTIQLKQLEKEVDTQIKKI